MLLGLACGNTFLELGDVPAVGNISTIGAQLADVAKQAFYDFGERPIFAERMTFGTGAVARIRPAPAAHHLRR
jgi:nuclear pore complex protein Nup155